VAVAIPCDAHSPQYRLVAESKNYRADHCPRRMRHFARQWTTVGGRIDIVNFDVLMAQ